jgi:riboflavin-specific deaminase-like protein
VIFDRLHPASGAVTAPVLLAEVRPGEHAPADRPYVFLNMVATVDGRATIDGRSGPIGSRADTRMFAELRVIADAVLIGTGTLRTERYSRLVRDEERRARRAAAGLSPDPAAVLFSRRLDLPWDAPLFADRHQRVIVACRAGLGLEPPPTAATVTLLELETPTLTAALRALRAQHGIRALLCEGGPTLNARLLAEGVLDELFLTVGPMLGGDASAPGIVGGDGPLLAAPAELQLRWLVRHGDELFLRYAVSRG